MQLIITADPSQGYLPKSIEWWESALPGAETSYLVQSEGLGCVHRTAITQSTLFSGVWLPTQATFECRYGGQGDGVKSRVWLQFIGQAAPDTDYQLRDLPLEIARVGGAAVIEDKVTQKIITLGDPAQLVGLERRRVDDVERPLGISEKTSEESTLSDAYPLYRMMAAGIGLILLLYWLWAYRARKALKQ